MTPTAERWLYVNFRFVDCVCGKTFLTTHATKNACSDICRKVAHRQKVKDAAGKPVRARRVVRARRKPAVKSQSNAARRG